MKPSLICGLVMLAVIVAEPAGAGRVAVAAYPSSMVVLGADAAAGRGSDPAHPYRDAPANSWATGTTSAVNSIYERLLAVDPAIRGHNFNIARDEAGVADFAGQVARAVRLIPKPQLVLVEIGGDVVCDGRDDSRVTQFGTDFGAALGKLAQGLPNARILVVAQAGPSPSYVKYMRGLPTSAWLKHAGKGPCQIVLSPTGEIEPSHVAYINKVIDGYNAEMAAACRRTPNCHYDGGASGRMNLTAADFSIDQFHLAIPGQAKLAATEWASIAGFVKGL